jgi:multisubunit Na+/H+ antiporter MnhB subunit
VVFYKLKSPDRGLSAIVLEAMANELLVFAARNLNKSDKLPAWLKQLTNLLRIVAH